MKGYVPNLDITTELSSNEVNASFIEIGVKQDFCERCNKSKCKCANKNKE